MLQPLSTDLYLASLPHLTENFRVTPAAVQQTLSLFVIGFGVTQLLSGPLSDRFGRRPVVLGGLVIYIIASIACALAQTLEQLVLARFLQAVGCCTAAVVARALIRDVCTPTEGARLIAKASSLLSIAPLFGPILGGYLQVWYGWRAAFCFQALFGAGLFIAAWHHLSETNQHPNPAATRLDGLFAIYRRIASSPQFWAYTLPGALSYATIFVFISGSPFVLIKVLGVPTEYYGYCFAFGVIGYLLGTIGCRRLLGRIGLPRTVALGTAMSAGSGLLFMLMVIAGAHHWSVILLCQFLVMLAHGINFPCAQSGSVAPFPREAGAAAGLLGFFTMTAALITGTWVGHSHDGTLLPMALTSAGIGLLLFGSSTAFHRARLAAT